VAETTHESLYAVVLAGEAVLGDQVLPDALRRQVLSQLRHDEFAKRFACALATRWANAGIRAAMGGRNVFRAGGHCVFRKYSGPF
jgi:hypothetical protein